MHENDSVAVGLAYREIEPILQAFGAEHQEMTYTQWRHEVGSFMFEWPRSYDINFAGIKKCIQVVLEYEPDCIRFGISAHAISNKKNLGKSFSVVSDVLPRQKKFIGPCLTFALALLDTVDEDDLLPAKEWEKKMKAARPFIVL